MKCPTCAANSVVLRYEQKEEHAAEHHRLCDNGHFFKTLEVYPTMVADARELRCAINNIERRITRYHRDVGIAADPRSTTAVAADHGLTDARVRQIRASFPDRASHERFAKIASNLERKST
jgi:hypothetical protein